MKNLETRTKNYARIPDVPPFLPDPKPKYIGKLFNGKEIWSCFGGKEHHVVDSKGYSSSVINFLDVQ